MAELQITRRPPLAGPHVAGLAIHNERVYSVVGVTDASSDGGQLANVVLIRRHKKDPFWCIAIDEVERLISLRQREGTSAVTLENIPDVLFAADHNYQDGPDAQLATDRLIVDVRRLANAMGSGGGAR